MITLRDRRTHDVVSCSGGKDSTATLLLALNDPDVPRDTLHVVFADTGNEHELTYEYLGYLETELGIKIDWLRADFNERIENKRRYIETKWREERVDESIVQRALEVLRPTGNPYLDLCLWKGRFPSRMAQFCTQELKTRPLSLYQQQIQVERGGDLWSWQGIRRDESEARKNALGLEQFEPGVWAYRPLIHWSAQQTVDYVRSCGVKLNPLYSKGMKRVGCMPCINAGKHEISQIAVRYPEHIDRIAEWEALVTAASKSRRTTFFPAVIIPGLNPELSNAEIAEQGSVWNVVKWAKTLRGGKKVDPQWEEAPQGCVSAYGLCE